MSVDLVLLYFPYIGIFLLLVLGGLGLPFPEDLTLILAGQIAFSEGLNLSLLFILCFIGVISMDLVLFHVGKKYGRLLFRYKFFRRIFTPKRRVQVKKQFHRFGDYLVFMARFVGGFRTAVFITAGTLKMSYTRFLFLDTIASCFSIPLFVLGSYYIGQQFEEIAHGLTTQIILGLMGFMIIIFAIVLLRWHFQAVKEEKK